MKLLIAGASGFIGSELVHHWKNKHEITTVGRTLSKLEHQFASPVQCVDWDGLNTLDANQYDAVINLCGKNIGESRWSDDVKKALIESRVLSTERLLDWMKQHQATPHFYCANAIGIYGLQDNGDPGVFDENTAMHEEHPSDFLQEISLLWQHAAERALEQGSQLTITRFGVVLKKGEGMLKKISPSFYLGFGSIIGDGQQVISWIHIDDILNGFDFLLKHQNTLQGPVNLCAPHPVTQREFARTLASAMHRPLWMKTPAFLIKWLFGEMGECLINRGQRVVPKRLLDNGYHFKYPDIHQALQKEFSE